MAAVFVLLSLLAVNAAASTLDDYRSRVERSAKAADGLSAMLMSDRSGPEIDQYITQTIASMRRDLPRTEKLEFQGGEIEISNRWLWSRLEQFDTDSNPQTRAGIMVEIYERLSAIEERIAEPTKEADRSKDEDKRKLAEILSREEYQKPAEQKESLFQRWIREFLEWLANIFPRPNIPQSQMPSAGALPSILQVLVYLGVIALIGYAIYRFAPYFARKLSREKDDEKGDRIILGEKIDANQSARSLMAEAEEIARTGDIRGAIRKGYMAFLCELHDRKAISLSRNKTNRDFLRDVRKRPGLFEGLKRLTGKFERHWYGFRRAELADWERFREEYNEAIKQV
jgi:hypothetical protein